jgi:protein-S-isoprenylcysteine O-methyltransferase Ste14
MGGVIWNVTNLDAQIALNCLFGLGVLIILAASFLINHFDLFGLRQVWLNLRGIPYTSLSFTTPGMYRVVRHPLYVGWLLMFWAAPVMTVAHLVFTLGTTAYILIAIQFEERDLVSFHKEYVEYRQQVPMLIPIGSSKRAVTVVRHTTLD